MRTRTLVSWSLAAALLAIVGCSDGNTGDGDAGPGDGGGMVGDTGGRDAMRPAQCGNLMVEGTEECDDGNEDPDDGCAPDCTNECGDGRVSGAEVCDPGVAAGETGACPTDCDDGVACTTDVISGSDCAVECVHGDITAPADDDSCCPTGADPSNDNDCAGTCGDGFVSGTETCDSAIAAGSVGACPTACDDGMACTTDALQMGGTCEAACTNDPITTPADGDGCCPSGATLATDDDCAIACGDGVVSSGEACDTAISAGSAGACPTTCNDGMACTTDALMGGGTCDAQCTSAAITMPINGDGCCPAGATMATDNDCTATCGDGVVSGGESCDTAIAMGAGRCPTTCSDGMACTNDVLTGAGTCAATCSFPAITMPANGDGCCPAGATRATDSDCPIACGDGVVSMGETCDTGIPTGTGSCPTTCTDGMVCTRDVLANMGTCTAACMFPAITMPMNGDMCCPPGATIGTDNDCAARCGDRVITAPETCDDGNTTSGDGCSATCMAETVMRTAFRLQDLDIMDPHPYARVSILGCTDVTNGPLGMGLNNTLQTNIQTDGDSPPDGQLDLSIVHLFRPLEQRAGMTTTSDLVFPDCTSPESSTMCTLPSGATRVTGMVTNLPAGMTCLGTLPMTVRPYSPAVTPSVAPTGGTCYVVNAGTVTFNLGAIPITLRDASIAGEWVGNPATTIADGLIRGFMSETDANATIIPPGTTGIATIDGQPLSSLLRGGAMNCSQPAPMAGDTDTYMGMRGWYFYLNFRARVVPYTEMP